MQRAALLLGRAADLSVLGLPSGHGMEIHAVDWDAFTIDSLDTRPEAVVAAIATREHSASAAFFARLAAQRLNRPVLAIVRAAEHDTLAPALEHADDIAFWPADSIEVAHRIDRLLRAAAPRRHELGAKLAEDLALAQLVGADARFLDAIRQIPLFARSDMPVLISGETGTGKELCARAVHYLSARRDEPFIAVDCSAIPDHLFENEMFGHARGAYTDAHVEQKGLVALARRGTLLLDEIDSLSYAAQGKLLRFLQEKTYRQLGGEKFTPAHATVLAATNCDLEPAVRERRFRADLYYRLNVLQIRLPPLRDRRDDIPLLARHFLAAASARLKAERAFSPQALRKLAAYDWPGNVRELWNLIQRAAVLAEGETVLPHHIEIPGSPAAPEQDTETFRTARARALAMFERGYLQDLLTRHAGNITRAARAAGKERRAFGRLVKKHNLNAQ